MRVGSFGARIVPTLDKAKAGGKLAHKKLKIFRAGVDDLVAWKKARERLGQRPERVFADSDGAAV